MREIGAFEAKNTFGTLLDHVESGEEVVITRRGKAVAKIVPITTASSRQAAAQALERIFKRRIGVRLRGLKIKDLVNEGRK